MKALKFEKPSMMLWDNNKITDHNRSPVSIATERIETKKRMANGTMRKYVVADKRTFSVSWTDLPHSAGYTVDGFWGGREIEKFHADHPGNFILKLNNGDGKIETVTVMFSEISKEYKKRGMFDFWDISVTMEES